MRLSLRRHPRPHCEILRSASRSWPTKGITLDIQEYDDYVIPNTIVEDGQCDTNYFSISPTWTTSMRRRAPTWSPLPVSTREPMGIYGGKQSDLSPIEG